MTDLTTPAAAERAAHLLQDELLASIIDAVREDVTQRWRATAPADVSERERCYHELMALDAVVRQLRIVADAGTYARYMDRRKSK